MKRILFIILVTLSASVTSVFSQGFTHITSKVAFNAEEMFATLETCNALEKSKIIYQKSIQEIKNNTFPENHKNA